MKRHCIPVLLIYALLAVSGARAGEWVRGGADGKQTWWGIPGGLQFAIAPASDGPRGLIRVLYPTLPEKKYDLINYIAIQPVVNGKEGYSELEPSKLDGEAGKRLWVEADQKRGQLSSDGQGVESLRVVIHVEAFKSGAHVRLTVEQRSNRPDEIAMSLHAEDDSAPMEYCVLTATMGNMARTRLLWLKEETISSLSLYPDYTGPHFATSMAYPLKRLAVTNGGDLLVAVTTDERRPAGVHPFPGSDRRTRPFPCSLRRRGKVSLPISRRPLRPCRPTVTTLLRRIIS